MLRKIEEDFPYFEIQRGAFKKCGIVDSEMVPSSKYEEIDKFIEGARYMYELLEVEEYQTEESNEKTIRSKSQIVIDGLVEGYEKEKNEYVETMLKYSNTPNFKTLCDHYMTLIAKLNSRIETLRSIKR